MTRAFVSLSPQRSHYQAAVASPSACMTGAPKCKNWSLLVPSASIMNLHRFFPSATELEASTIQDVAGAILQVLHDVHKESGGTTNFRNFMLQVREGFRRFESQAAAAEAWNWLTTKGLICQHPEQDQGWFFLSRQGLASVKFKSLAIWAQDRLLPEELVHNCLRGHCMSLYRQGQFDTAVFQAFKQLEVRFREAAKLSNEFLGVNLARRAFATEGGPLTDETAERGERESLMHLMSGAIGSYKNPQSHRHVGLDPAEAREMIILASHLLRIVDSRQPLQEQSSTESTGG